MPLVDSVWDRVLDIGGICPAGRLHVSAVCAGKASASGGNAGSAGVGVDVRVGADVGVGVDVTPSVETRVGAGERVAFGAEALLSWATGEFAAVHPARMK